MYIVRWLMGHPILAAWILAAIAILLNFTMGDKEEETVASQPETVIEENTNTQPNASNSVLSQKSTETKKELADGSSTEKLEKTMAAVTTPEVNYPPADEVKNISSDEGNHAKNAIADKNPAKPDLTIVNADDVNKEENVISDLSELNPEEMLTMAREAYWNNGLDEAAQIYKHLIKIEPDKIEHRGELGNVFWRQGYPKQAAELYSEISLPMIEQGKADRVANMIGFIGLFYPDRAAEIHKRLESETEKSKN